MAFNLSDYETVESRLEKWWKDYPDGRVATKIVQATDTRFIVGAELYKTTADQVSCATGFAYEDISDRGVNSTSALENCETSAIGRALANAGYAAKGKRASREEMAKVVRGENEQPKPTYGPPGSRARAVAEALRSKDFSAFEAPMLEEPAPVKWSVDEVVDAIGASTPNEPPACCDAGHTLKQGMTKGGKPYYGYVCKANIKEHAQWASITANGKWYFKGGE